VAGAGSVAATRLTVDLHRRPEDLPLWFKPD
jgi:hypothetical protein